MRLFVVVAAAAVGLRRPRPSARSVLSQASSEQQQRRQRPRRQAPTTSRSFHRWRRWRLTRAGEVTPESSRRLVGAAPLDNINRRAPSSAPRGAGETDERRRQASSPRGGKAGLAGAKSARRHDASQTQLNSHSAPSLQKVGIDECGRSSFHDLEAVLNEKLS
jgi:hypothetical protein